MAQDEFVPPTRPAVDEATYATSTLTKRIIIAAAVAMVFVALALMGVTPFVEPESHPLLLYVVPSAILLPAAGLTLLGRAVWPLKLEVSQSGLRITRARHPERFVPWGAITGCEFRGDSGTNLRITISGEPPVNLGIATLERTSDLAAVIRTQAAYNRAQLPEPEITFPFLIRPKRDPARWGAALFAVIFLGAVPALTFVPGVATPGDHFAIYFGQLILFALGGLLLVVSLMQESIGLDHFERRLFRFRWIIPWRDVKSVVLRRAIEVRPMRSAVPGAVTFKRGHRQTKLQIQPQAFSAIEAALRKVLPPDKVVLDETIDAELDPNVRQKEVLKLWGTQAEFGQLKGMEPFLNVLVFVYPILVPGLFIVLGIRELSHPYFPHILIWRVIGAFALLTGLLLLGALDIVTSRVTVGPDGIEKSNCFVRNKFGWSEVRRVVRNSVGKRPSSVLIELPDRKLKLGQLSRQAVLCDLVVEYAKAHKIEVRERTFKLG